MLSGSTSQDLKLDQALRRLKYLHTSLSQPQFCHTTLKDFTNASQDTEPRASIPAKTITCDSFCLQPLQKGKSEKSAPISVHSHTSNKICKGRAPLISPTAYFHPACLPTRHSVAGSKDFLKFRDNSQHLLSGKRLSRSAPVLNGVEKCEKCCCERETLKLPKTNGADQVRFLARPQTHPKEDLTRSSHQTVKKFRLPETCRNGWGVRSNHRRPAEGHTNPASLTGARSGVRSVKLEPKRSDERALWIYGRGSDPPPPPTPVQQVDIKLPHRRLVQYWLLNLD